MEPFTMGARTSGSDDGTSVGQMRRLNSDPIGRTKGSRLKRMWSRTLDAVVATRTKEGQPLDGMAPTTQTRLSTSTLEVQDDQIDLLEKVGSGGFGDVHKAFWRGTLVACKTIRADMLSEEKQAALEDLKLEVQVLQQLRHPNIMMLLAYKTTAAHQLMISELMACSLLDVLKSGSVVFNKPGLCENLAIRYAIQLSQGMNYLHTCDPPIMHRDLKPENLLLDHSGTLKVADFGLAKLRPRPMPQVDPEKQMMTGETGSYRYMAPEVFRHEAYNESVDVYSFAMIFFYMVSGRPPFMNMDGLEAVKAAATEKKRPELPRLRPLSPALAELLESTWCSEASERLTFDVVLKKLRSYYEKTWNHTLEETMMKEAAEKIASLNRAYGGAQGNEGGCCSVM